MEREAKKPSEMVDRRENEASSDQMKADGREIDRASSPFRAGFKKNLANQTSSQKTSLSRSALECNCEDFIQLKAYRNHPLSQEDKKRNRLRSRIRVRVEHVFGGMSQLAMDRLRTIGKERAHHHNGLSNLVYNMDRYAFLMK